MASRFKKCLMAKESEFIEYASTFQTPFYIYDESIIRNTCQNFKSAFSWCPGFVNYFAVKATPNPHILKILKEEGFGVDCSSLAELALAKSVGFKGEEIFFTSNNTPLCEFEEAKKLGGILNLDDINHIDFIQDGGVGLPEYISFRYNPGTLRDGGNSIIGTPKDAKFGLTRNQIIEAYTKCRDLGVKRFALHTMVMSNCLDEMEFIKTARIVFELVVEIMKKVGIRIELVNLGGGIGIPYKPEDKPVDLDSISQGIRFEYNKIIAENGLAGLKICFECGRFITGPAGNLVTRIIHKKETYKKYIGVDACMANLMRPALYGAYHHMTLIKDLEFSDRGRKAAVVEQENGSIEEPIVPIVYDVVGSLCENNDKLAVDRDLGPSVEIGDLIVIHDVGAHGHSMGFNYNGKLRCAEYLRKGSGVLVEIRRAETLNDLFSTISNWKFD